MCFGTITLLIGFVLLIKGDFRLGTRYVPKPRGRLIGLLLMAPFVITFCYSSAVTYPMMMEAMDEVGMDYDRVIDRVMERMEDPNTTSLRVSLELVEYGSLVLAVGAAAYLILTVPPGAAPSSAFGVGPSGGMPAQRPPTPNVMTPAEVATYLRVTEAEVRALIDKGQLPAAHIGGDFRIARIAVDDFLARRANDDDPFVGV